MSVSETAAPPPSPLREERHRQGLRLIDLSERASVSVGMLSMIERGYFPRMAVRVRIAKALRKAPATLWPEAR